MNFPKSVEIVEVGPRDGIQNEKNFIPTEHKVALINRLGETGLRRIEAASFVSPVHVPQMRDAGEVMQTISMRNNIQYMALVPNEKGYEIGLEKGVRAFNVVVGASDTFNQRNVRMSRSDSVARLKSIITRCKQQGQFIRYSIATAFWCPFEGRVEEGIVLQMAEEAAAAGVDEIAICDTIGRANPGQVYSLFSRVLDRSLGPKIAAHFHDTYGFAQANTIAALRAGVSVFDSAAGGLGGCPFAPGAAGNAATEDLVFMLQEMGIDTGVDVQKLLEIVDFVKTLTERKLTGRLHSVRH